MPPPDPIPATGIRTVGTLPVTSFSAGVPINDVSAVMGHEQTSTTLDRYTHPSQDRDQRVRSVFADFLLTPDPEPEPKTEQEPTDEDS
jgi:hypothetical protein